MSGLVVRSHRVLTCFTREVSHCSKSVTWADSLFRFALSDYSCGLLANDGLWRETLIDRIPDRS